MPRKYGKSRDSCLVTKNPWYLTRKGPAGGRVIETRPMFCYEEFKVAEQVKTDLYNLGQSRGSRVRDVNTTYSSDRPEQFPTFETEQHYIVKGRIKPVSELMKGEEPPMQNPVMKGKPSLWYPTKGSEAAKDLGSLLQKMRKATIEEKVALKKTFKEARSKWMARDGFSPPKAKPINATVKPINGSVDSLLPTGRTKKNPDDYSSATGKVVAQQEYGQRKEVADEPGYIVSWSNNSQSWSRGRLKVSRGDELTLDANEIILYGKKKSVDRLAKTIPPLPLYRYSTEAKERKEMDYEDRQNPVHDNPTALGSFALGVAGSLVGNAITEKVNPNNLPAANPATKCPKCGASLVYKYIAESCSQCGYSRTNPYTIGLKPGFGPNMALTDSTFFSEGEASSAIADERWSFLVEPKKTAKGKVWYGQKIRENPYAYKIFDTEGEEMGRGFKTKDAAKDAIHDHVMSDVMDYYGGELTMEEAERIVNNAATLWNVAPYWVDSKDWGKATFQSYSRKHFTPRKNPWYVTGSDGKVHDPKQFKTQKDAMNDAFHYGVYSPPVFDTRYTGFTEVKEGDRVYKDGMVERKDKSIWRDNPYSGPMTQKSVQQYLARLGLVMKKDEAGDYRVSYKALKGDDAERSAHYTPHLDDALGTGEAMAKWWADTERMTRKNPALVIIGNPHKCEFCASAPCVCESEQEDDGEGKRKNPTVWKVQGRHSPKPHYFKIKEAADAYATRELDALVKSLHRSAKGYERPGVPVPSKDEIRAERQDDYKVEPEYVSGAMYNEIFQDDYRLAGIGTVGHKPRKNPWVDVVLNSSGEIQGFYDNEAQAHSFLKMFASTRPDEAPEATYKVGKAYFHPEDWPVSEDVPDGIQQIMRLAKSKPRIKLENPWAYGMGVDANDFDKMPPPEQLFKTREGWSDAVKDAWMTDQMSRGMTREQAERSWNKGWSFMGEAKPTWVDSKDWHRVKGAKRSVMPNPWAYKITDPDMGEELGRGYKTKDSARAAAKKMLMNEALSEWDGFAKKKPTTHEDAEAYAEALSAGLEIEPYWVDSKDWDTETRPTYKEKFQKKNPWYHVDVFETKVIDGLPYLTKKDALSSAGPEVGSVYTDKAVEKGDKLYYPGSDPFGPSVHIKKRKNPRISQKDWRLPMTFDFHGKKYRATSRMIETDFGPENRVKIYDEHGQLVDQKQEPASTKMVVGWFKRDRDDHDEDYPDEFELTNPFHIVTSKKGRIISHEKFDTKRDAEDFIDGNALPRGLISSRFTDEDATVGDIITKGGEVWKQSKKNPGNGAVKVPKGLERQIMKVPSKDRDEVMLGIKKYYEFHGCFPPRIIAENVDHAKVGYPKVNIALGIGTKVDYQTRNSKSNKFFAGGKGRYEHKFGDELKNKKNSKPTLVTDPTGTTLHYLPSKFKVKDWIHH